MIAVVILAAGSGSRLGGDKLLVDLGGEPLLVRVVRRAVEAALGPVLVVLPPGAPGGVLRDALAGVGGCTLLENPSPGEGMNGSLAIGLRAVPVEHAAAVVLLGDMPFVAPERLRAMGERWRRGGVPLVASRYGEVLAPPALFDRSLFDELCSGPAGDGRGREVTRRHLEDAALVDWPPEALADVDGPGDLAQARERLAAEWP
ncbi:MAG TPA: nucleotidyltransferase family protein [Anaeromyxobacteraceae bacterium]